MRTWSGMTIDERVTRCDRDGHPGTDALVLLGSVEALARRKRAVVVRDGLELLVLCVRRRFTVVAPSPAAPS